MIKATHKNKTNPSFLLVAIIIAGAFMLFLSNHGTISGVAADEFPAKNISDDICKENWICSNWGACSSDGSQSRVCADQNSCGTTKNEPSKMQRCAPIPAPAPQMDIRNATIVLSSVVLVLILAIVTMSIIIVAQKKKLAGQLYNVISKANASLSAGDKASAMNSYKVLMEYFTRFQNKVSKKDAQRLHVEGMRLYENLSR